MTAARCPVKGCNDKPVRGGYGPCPTHRESRKAHGTPLLAPARRRVDQVPVLMPAPVQVDITPAPAVEGHRCGSCGLVFPLLVDEILCVSCDSLHYPAAVAS